MPENRRLHLHFYNYYTEEIGNKFNLTLATLLFLSILVQATMRQEVIYDSQKSAWLTGYFRVIGSVNLAELPAVKRAMFVDSSGWLYNEIGDAIEYERLDEADV